MHDDVSSSLPVHALEVVDDGRPRRLRSRVRRRLPPAKDLAAVLDVNTNTVLRDLRDEVVARTRELVDFARHHGYRTDELVRIIEDIT